MKEKQTKNRRKKKKSNKNFFFFCKKINLKFQTLKKSKILSKKQRKIQQLSLVL